jgi:hypothetical protein
LSAALRLQQSDSRLPSLITTFAVALPLATLDPPRGMPGHFSIWTSIGERAQAQISRDGPKTFTTSLNGLSFVLITRTSDSLYY